MSAEPIPTRRWILDLAATALLLAVPIAGFWPTFGGPNYLAAALGGLVLGLGIAAFGARLRWGTLTIAALTLGAYFLFGGALALPHTTIAGFVPTIDTLRQLALGVVTSWKQLLTTVAPVAASDGHLIVPFLLTLVAAVLTGSLALRLSQPAWALLPAVVMLVAEIAVGTSEPAIPLVQGVVFALVAIVWLALRQAWAPSRSAVLLGDASGAPGPSVVRRLVAGGAIIAVAGAVGVAASAAAAPDSPRYILRDVIIPPFDIKQYPSPLQSFRAYVRDDKETPLFTVTGLPEGARVRIAAMDAYNGVVYNVSDSGAGSSSAFTPLRSNMSAGAEGEPATLKFTIDEYESVWMPDAGEVQTVTFTGKRADDVRRAAHFNESTEVGVVTSKLKKGDAYTLTTIIPVVPADESLVETPFAPLAMPKQEGVPEELAEIASTAVKEAETPIAQARALESMLAEGGTFSHGLKGEVLSRAGHGAERITALFGGVQMIGDDEQYATAMALLARDLGMPARVVMGFYPDEAQADEEVFTATGDTLHAWVEIAFDGAGWVPFDPTPSEDNVPNEQAPEPKSDPKPQVLQPPPPEQAPVDLPPTVPDDRETEDETEVDLSTLFAIIGWSLAGLALLALLALPFIVIGAIKATRRRRRRVAELAADRISGGWDELRDRAVDYGTAVPAGATYGEDADVIATSFAEPRVMTLARRADAEVFGPTEPTPADIEEFWHQVDEIVGSMGAKSSFWGRIRARLSLRSLLAGTRWEALARPRSGRPRRDTPTPTSPEEGS